MRCLRSFLEILRSNGGNLDVVAAYLAYTVVFSAYVVLARDSYAPE